MVDSAHSALMALHVVPPSPEHLGELMEEHLVKRRYLNRDYIEWYEDVRKKAKEVLYGDVTRVSGKEIEELQRKSEQFVQTLTKLTREFIKNEKIIRTEMKQV